MDIDKAFIKGNLGLACRSQGESDLQTKESKKTDPYANSNYIGTEVNAEVGYKISQNLTASLVGGYVFLGDYYKDTAEACPTAPSKPPTTPGKPWWF